MASTDYTRIEKAISFILEKHKEQPSLDEIASYIHLSPHHFQRLFVNFAGVSPKQFLQLITTEYAKNKLLESDTMTTSLAAGLSGTGRLYDHFVKIESVTPGEFKSKGQGLTFHYGLAESKFGNTFICWTDKGIHKLSFIEGKQEGDQLKQALETDWCRAQFSANNQQANTICHGIFNSESDGQTLRLWLKGSTFQIAVWRALLSLGKGQVSTYKKIAEAVERPNAYRAVGTAIGANPIAYLIPCHRVIQQSGMLGGYRWKPERKSIILGCEFIQDSQGDKQDRVNI